MKTRTPVALVFALTAATSGAVLGGCTTLQHPDAETPTLTLISEDEQGTGEKRFPHQFPRLDGEHDAETGGYVFRMHGTDRWGAEAALSRALREMEFEDELPDNQGEREAVSPEGTPVVISAPKELGDGVVEIRVDPAGQKPSSGVIIETGQDLQVAMIYYLDPDPDREASAERYRFHVNALNTRINTRAAASSFGAVHSHTAIPRTHAGPRMPTCRY